MDLYSAGALHASDDNAPAHDDDHHNNNNYYHDDDHAAAHDDDDATAHDHSRTMIYYDETLSALIKAQNYALLDDGVNVRVKGKMPQVTPANDYLIAWGDNPKGINHAVMETGFFQNALHLDKTGLYERASFNYPDGRREVEAFKAPRPWKDIAHLIHAKYGQPNSTQSWEGVVLACQHPNDRSVLKAGGTKDYYAFIEEACRFYGRQLYLKKHPVMVQNKECNGLLEGLALKHGCELGHIGSSILGRAEAVLVYNSTFVVDALMHGRHVMQYAPGYFWQAGVVQYLHKKLDASRREADPVFVNQFIDFLLWKYCFHAGLELEKVRQILSAFHLSRDLFPLPQHLSYAHTLTCTGDASIHHTSP